MKSEWFLSGPWKKILKQKPAWFPLVTATSFKPCLFSYSYCMAIVILVPQVRAQMKMRTYIRARLHVCMQAHTYTHTHARACTRVLKHMHTYTHARTQARALTRMQARALTHAHTRTHTYSEHSTCLLYHSRALLLILIETLGSLLVKLSLHFWDSLIYSKEAKAAHYIT